MQCGLAAMIVSVALLSRRYVSCRSPGGPSGSEKQDNSERGRLLTHVIPFPLYRSIRLKRVIKAEGNGDYYGSCIVSPERRVFAIGHIDGAGQYVETQSGANFDSSWGWIVAVAGNILFMRGNGISAVGHIDGAGVT